MEKRECVQGAHILAGNTAAGVYHEWPDFDIIMSINGVKELSRVSRTQVRPPISYPTSNTCFSHSFST